MPHPLLTSACVAVILVVCGVHTTVVSGQSQLPPVAEDCNCDDYDTSPSTTPDCDRTPERCFDDFHAVLTSCVDIYNDDPDAPDREQILQECLCGVQCLAQSCIQRVCDFNPATGGDHSRAGCLGLYRSRLASCRNLYTRRDARRACNRHALLEYFRCIETAPDGDPNDLLIFASMLSPSGVLASGEVASSQAAFGMVLDVGGMIAQGATVIPDAIQVVAVYGDGGVISVETIVAMDYDPSNDLNEVLVSLDDIAESANLSDLTLSFEWLVGGEVIYVWPETVDLLDSPVPGDFNRNGAAGLDDVLSHITASMAGADRADVNNDGVADAMDTVVILDALGTN